MNTESNDTNKDFTKYEHMETEELEEILRADFYISGADSSDEERMNYILDILTRRDNDVLESNLMGAEKSLERFKEEHAKKLRHIPAGKKRERSDEVHGTIIQRKKTSRFLRFPAIAAVVCIILLGSITVNSAGWNLWDRIAKWTDDAFHFESHGQVEADIVNIPEPLKSTAETLAEYGITKNAVPSFLPDGCEFKDYSIYSDPENIFIVTVLSRNSESYIFEYVIHLRAVYDSEYEKDEGEPNIIEHNGIPFYVFTNYGKYVITWMDGNLECMIANIPEEFIEQIINSI